jgi:hypothetical protein
LPRFASIAPLKRLTFDHLLCPAILADSYAIDDWNMRISEQDLAQRVADEGGN